MRAGRLGGVLAWALAALPVVSLALASVLDLGPDGVVRASVFNVALAALDPHVWDACRNSLLNAAAVTLAARVLGVGLARVATRRRFWGRPVLSALAASGLAASPAFLAIGLRAWLMSRSIDVPDWLAPMLPWLAWFWVTLVPLAPIVALAAASELERVQPAWEDAARLEGASGRRTWRHLLWPVARPGVAKALAAVFTIALIEPGGPLVLGLRRTLGFQIVEAATDPSAGQLTHASVLALGATLIALAARTLIGWWGGTETPGLSREERPVGRAATCSLWSGLVWASVLALAAAFVWLPLLGLMLSARRPEEGALAMLSEGLTRRYVRNSALLGVGVVLLDLILARLGRARRLEGVPPLALGVGALALPTVLRMAASLLSREPMPTWLAHAIDLCDPIRTPGSALLLAVALARLPLVARAAADRRDRLRPVLIDAALTLGATSKAARKTLPGRWLGVAPASALLTFVLAATNVSPALILTPTAESRTIGPAIVTFVDQPGDGFARACILGSLAFAANLVVIAWSARRGSGVQRTWLRT